MSHYPQYPTDADYQTNAPSYSDHIARHEQLMKYLANRVWEYDKEMAVRLAAWDKNLESFDDDVMVLLREWVNDGTFDTILNEELMSQKIDRTEYEAYTAAMDSLVNKKQNTDSLPFIDVMETKARYPFTDTQAMQFALDQAKVKGGVHVVVPAGVTLRMTAELKVYQNTTIEMKPGAKIIREHLGYMVMNGNRKTEANPSNFFGYGGNGNLKFIGGTWDANGVAFPGKASIFHLGHADGILVKDVTFKDCANSHHIEFNACRYIYVKRTKFLGTAGEIANVNEAIQFDIPVRDGATIGSGDGTPCERAYITECYFGRSNTPGSEKIPRGIGSHSAIIGSKHQHIYIINNIFEDIHSYSIRCFNYENVKIDGNTFINCGAGINIRTAITGVNTQNLAGLQVGSEENRHIIITNNSFKGWSGAGRMIEVYGETDSLGFIRHVLVDGNNITQDGAAGESNPIMLHKVEHAIVSNNNIRYGKGNSIHISYCAGVKVFGNNIIDAEKDGIFVTNSYYVDVDDNTLIRTAFNGIFFYETEGFTVDGNTVAGVNGGRATVDYDFNHVRVVTNCKLGLISNNLFRGVGSGFSTPTSVYVTQANTDVHAKNNMGVGMEISMAAINSAADANGNIT